MTLPILTATVREADPRRNYRLADFLTTLGLRPEYIPDPGPAEVPPCDCQEDPPEADVPAAAEAPGGGSGTGDERPGLEPYVLKSVSVPATDETAEADAEAGQ